MRLTRPGPRRLAPLAAAIALAALAAGCAGPQGAGVVALGDVRGYQPPAVAVEGARYHFTPFEGVPGNIGDQVLRDLRREARAEGITVVRRADRPTDFRVVGHMSAVTNDTTSIIFYDFDVVDATSGALVHRISGQQTSSPSRGDPWARVEREDLRHMARVVAARLGAWIRAARA